LLFDVFSLRFVADFALLDDELLRCVEGEDAGDGLRVVEFVAPSAK
jgi:hypothetical protein